MISELKDVSEYIASVPDERQDALQRLRKLCQSKLPDHEETMEYKMPSYRRHNQVEVAFASQKQYISVYFLIHSIMIKNAVRLTEINHGKGCLRFPNPRSIDFELIEHLLAETAKSTDKIC